eukprot:6481890-Amphidinium_carterae.3
MKPAGGYQCNSPHHICDVADHSDTAVTSRTVSPDRAGTLGDGSKPCTFTQAGVPSASAGSSTWPLSHSFFVPVWASKEYVREVLGFLMATDTKLSNSKTTIGSNFVPDAPSCRIKCCRPSWKCSF